MARRLRLSYPGAVFHISTRGNNRRPVYGDGQDRRVFLRLVEKVAERYAWRVHAYCLMTTHYHLVVEVPEDGLSAGLCLLNGGFARWSNFRYGREDHVFGRRFWSKEVVSVSQFLETCRYVHLNPVYAGIVGRPDDWRWSSYLATVADEHAPSYLYVGRLLSAFDDRPQLAIERYRAFVAKGLDEWRHGSVPGTVP